MTLANHIRTARQAAGLTQHELACCASVSKQHISFLEQGRRVGSPTVLRAIGDVLGISLHRIYWIERRRLQRKRRWTGTYR